MPHVSKVNPLVQEIVEHLSITDPDLHERYQWKLLERANDEIRRLLRGDFTEEEITSLRRKYLIARRSTKQEACGQ
jgi:hypothetical protein